MRTWRRRSASPRGLSRGACTAPSPSTCRSGRRSFRLSATKSQAADRGHRTWSNSSNVDSRHVDGSEAVVLEGTWTRDIVRCSGGLQGVCGRLRFWLSAEYMLYGAAIGCILLNVGGTFCFRRSVASAPTFRVPGNTFIASGQEGVARGICGLSQSSKPCQYTKDLSMMVQPLGPSPPSFENQNRGSVVEQHCGCRRSNGRVTRSSFLVISHPSSLNISPLSLAHIEGCRGAARARCPRPLSLSSSITVEYQRSEGVSST